MAGVPRGKLPLTASGSGLLLGEESIKALIAWVGSLTPADLVEMLSDAPFKTDSSTVVKLPWIDGPTVVLHKTRKSMVTLPCSTDVKGDVAAQRAVEKSCQFVMKQQLLQIRPSSHDLSETQRHDRHVSKYNQELGRMLWEVMVSADVAAYGLTSPVLAMLVPHLPKVDEGVCVTTVHARLPSSAQTAHDIMVGIVGKVLHGDEDLKVLVEQAVKLVQSIVAALYRLHAAGWIHNDTWMRNWMIVRGVARPVDFEMAAPIPRLKPGSDVSAWAMKTNVLRMWDLAEVLCTEGNILMTEWVSTRNRNLQNTHQLDKIRARARRFHIDYVHSVRTNIVNLLVPPADGSVWQSVCTMRRIRTLNLPPFLVTERVWLDPLSVIALPRRGGVRVVLNSLAARTTSRASTPQDRRTMARAVSSWAFWNASIFKRPSALPDVVAAMRTVKQVGKELVQRSVRVGPGSNPFMLSSMLLEPDENRERIHENLCEAFKKTSDYVVALPHSAHSVDELKVWK